MHPSPTAAGARRRVLFLTPQAPYPPEQGTALRNYHLLDGVAATCDVDLLTFGDPVAPVPDPLRQVCRQIVVVRAPVRRRADRLRTLLTSREPDMAHRLRSSEFAAALARLLAGGRYDVLQVEGVELAQYGLQATAAGASRPLLVYDDHNAEYLLQRRAMEQDLRRPGRWPAAAYSLVQWRRLARYERLACRAADAVLAVSDQDAAAIRALDPALSPVTVPNGVDTTAYHPHLGDTLPLQHPAVVFTGKMDYRPNVDAALWLGARVWPLVRRALPGARLYIVGQSPHARLDALRRDASITITGYVESVLPYLGGADVYVAPLRVGGGTRLKILQALAAGRALVATPLGAEGIALEDGVHALLAEGAEAFAGAVVRLAKDRTLAARLGEAGRALVCEQYAWERIVPRLLAVYDRLG